jgi:glyoxylate reductase
MGGSAEAPESDVGTLWYNCAAPALRPVPQRSDEGGPLPMAKVFVTRNIYPEALEILEQNVEVKIWEEDRTIPRDVLLREIADADGVLTLLTEKVDDEFLDHAPNVRVVANMAVGFDNISVPACTDRKVVVTNTPGVLTETTADMAFALLMAVARFIVPGMQYVRDGRWKTWSPSLFVGQDVHHATLGIVGLGRIGQEMAKRGRGFDMEIIYYDVYRREDLERQHGWRYVDLDTLLRESDFVTVHVDLNDQTRKMFSTEAFKKMKQTAYLINAARGPIVDTDALYQAVKDGEIAGAGLDVTDPEPLPADHPILTLENVVVCPHIASASIQTRTKMAILAAENIVNVLKGEKPKTPVNPEVLG